MFFIFVCYWTKKNPTFLSQKTENLVFKILKKNYFNSGLGPKRQTKLDSPKKQQRLHTQT